MWTGCSDVAFWPQSPWFDKATRSQSPYRLVVRTSRCGRDNPGSTPGKDIYAGRECGLGRPARAEQTPRHEGATAKGSQSGAERGGPPTKFGLAVKGIIPARRGRVRNEKVTAVGFEPTPFRNGALSHRLRPLGQTVLLVIDDRRSGVKDGCCEDDWPLQLVQRGSARRHVNRGGGGGGS